MDLGTTATIVGTDVAAISIIIVYHLFALQTWTERGHELLNEAIGLSTTTSPDDLLRQDLIRRATTLFRQFPWSQVTALGVAVMGMCALGLYTARHVGDGSTWLMVAGPVLVLGLTYVLSTTLIWVQGRGVLEQTDKYLGGLRSALEG